MAAYSPKIRLGETITRVLQVPVAQGTPSTERSARPHQPAVTRWWLSNRGLRNRTWVTAKKCSHFFKIYIINVQPAPSMGAPPSGQKHDQGEQECLSISRQLLVLMFKCASGMNPPPTTTISSSSSPSSGNFQRVLRNSDAAAKLTNMSAHGSTF